MIFLRYVAVAVTIMGVTTPFQSWGLELTDLKAGQKLFNSTLGEEVTITNINSGVFGYFQKISARSITGRDIAIGSDELKNLYQVGCNARNICTGQDSYLRVYGLGKMPDQGVVMRAHLIGISGDKFIARALEDEPTFSHKKGDVVYGEVPEIQKVGECGSEGFCVGDRVVFYKSGRQSEPSGEAGLSTITSIFAKTANDDSIRYGLEGDAKFDHVARTSTTFVKATSEMRECVKKPESCQGTDVLYEDSTQYAVHSDSHQFLYNLIGSGKAIATSNALASVVDSSPFKSNFIIYLVDKKKPGHIFWTTKESVFLSNGCMTKNSLCVGDIWRSKLPYQDYSGPIVSVAPAGQKIAVKTQGVLPGGAYWTDVTVAMHMDSIEDSGCTDTSVGPICVNDVIQNSGKVVAISQYDFYVRDQQRNVRHFRASDFRGEKLSK